MNKQITRLMIRLNLIMKVIDNDTNEVYYAFIKSSKVWADMNFISVRIDSLDNISVPVDKDEKNEFIVKAKDMPTLTQKFEEIEQFLTYEKCKYLVEKELDKVFGIKQFDGVLQDERIDYIEESKTVNEITYYHNRFFVIKKISDINRIIGLKTIELIPQNIFEKLHKKEYSLHDRYAPSNLLKKFIEKRIWTKDLISPLKLEVVQHKKRIGVLFSDLKDFGNLVNQFELEEEAEFTRLFIKKYQHLASIEIKIRGGYVVQTAGDAFMAIFQLSDDEMENIKNMLEAALHILSISEISIHSKYPSIPVKTRIGINIAEVEEGFLGALDLREYTVFGKDVNIASRLEKKVGEYGEFINGFSGGILLNIANSKPELDNIENKTDELSDYLLKHSANFTNIAFKKRLADFASSLKYNFHLDCLFELVKAITNNTIQELNQTLKNQNHCIQIAEDLKEFSVKEGMTNCVYVYKTTK